MYDNYVEKYSHTQLKKKEKKTRKGKWSVTEASNIYNNQELI